MIPDTEGTVITMNDDRLISLNAAIDALWHSIECENGGELQSYAEAVAGDAEDALKALPPAQQWIPCSERLPEEEKTYLVTFANEKVGMSSWHKDTLYNRGFDAYLTGVTEDGECEYFGVVAWMEKPEPWKGGPDEH